MATVQMGRDCPVYIPVNANHVLLEFFVCLVKCLLIVFTFAFSIANQAFAVSNKYQNTTLIDSIELCDICDWVRVHKHQSELICIKYLVVLFLKPPFGASGMELRVRLSFNALFYCWVSYRVHSFFMLLGYIIVVFHLLASSELFEHYHFIAPVFWAFRQEQFFLFVLCSIDDIGPLLLVFGTEVSQEFVERLVSLSHWADWGVEWFAFRLLGLLNKFL